MADIQGMLADPQFNALDAATQREALSRLDPDIGHLSDQDYANFRQRTSKTSVPGMERLGGVPPAAGQRPNVNIREVGEVKPMRLPGETDSGWNPLHWISRAENVTVLPGLTQLSRVPFNLAAGRKAEAASNTLEGSGRVLAPLGIAAAAEAPVAGAIAGLSGIGAQRGGEALARHFGASPETERAVGDVAALVGGGIGGKLGGVLSKAAAPLAENALGIRGTTKAYGATPGKAILEETKGLTPSKIESSARQRIGELGNELESRAATTNTPGSLKPVRRVVSRDINQAASRNSISTPNELAPLQRFLTEPTPEFRGNVEYPTGAHTPITYQQPQSNVLGPNGQPILGSPRVIPGASPAPVVAEEQPASTLLGMRRQLNTDFVRNWNPAVSTKGALGTARRAYGALGGELDRIVPGGSGLDQRISSLIPVADRARLVDLNEGTVGRMLGRATARTGSLVAPLFGFHAGGARGLAEVLAGQEMLSSPTFKMGLARALNFTGKPLSAPAGAILGERRDFQ